MAGISVSILATPWSGPLSGPAFVDTGAVSDGVAHYYDLRGLSPCTHTPGP